MQKKNTFTINAGEDHLKENTIKKYPQFAVTEESNYFINCFFCQYRSTKLLIYDKKTKMKYVAERTCIVPWGQMNMKIKKYSLKEKWFQNYRRQNFLMSLVYHYRQISRTHY